MYRREAILLQASVAYSSGTDPADTADDIHTMKTNRVPLANV